MLESSLNHPLPPSLSVENLSSMKLAPGAPKVGNLCYRQSLVRKLPASCGTLGWFTVPLHWALLSALRSVRGV